MSESAECLKEHFLVVVYNNWTRVADPLSEYDSKRLNSALPLPFHFEEKERKKFLNQQEFPLSGKLWHEEWLECLNMGGICHDMGIKETKKELACYLFGDSPKELPKARICVLFEGKLPPVIDSDYEPVSDTDDADSESDSDSDAESSFKANRKRKGASILDKRVKKPRRSERKPQGKMTSRRPDKEEDLSMSYFKYTRDGKNWMFCRAWTDVILQIYAGDWWCNQRIEWLPFHQFKGNIKDSDGRLYNAVLYSNGQLWVQRS